MKDKLIDFITFIGTIDAFVIPTIFAMGQEQLFPFPGLYFIEIGLVSLCAAYSIFSRRWPLVPWLASGILLAFVVLGAFTIGFYLTPAMLAYAAAAVLWTGMPVGRLLRSAGWALLAALLQAILMIGIVYVAG